MIKFLIRKFLDQSKKADEIIWANIYHDSIRGRNYLENLNLNIGRWAGNYTFFYILNRVLHDFQPKSILEIGLGESSKFIMACSKNILKNTQHIIVEHDPNWISLYRKNNEIPNNSVFFQLDLIKKKFKGYTTFSYRNFYEKLKDFDFDLIIIDGPFGSKKYSRNDILLLVKHLDPKQEFIIIFDDTERTGEKDTVKLLIKEINKKGIPINVEHYNGVKTVSVIATNTYKYATSL